MRHLVSISTIMFSLCLAACGGGGSSPMPHSNPTATPTIAPATPTPTPKPSTSPQSYTVAVQWSGLLAGPSKHATSRYRMDDGVVVETPEPILVSTSFGGSGEDALLGAADNVDVAFSPEPSASPQVAYSDNDPTQSTLGPTILASAPPDSIGVFGGSAPGTSMITASVTEPITATVPVQVATYSSAYVQCAPNGNGVFENAFGLIFNNDNTVTLTQDPTVADLYFTGPSPYCTGAFATPEGSNFVLNAPGGLNLFPLSSTDFASLTAAAFVPGTTSYTLPTVPDQVTQFQNNTMILLQTRMGVYVKLVLGPVSTSNYGAVAVPALDVADSSGVFEY